jgi:hypothetical protein
VYADDTPTQPARSGRIAIPARQEKRTARNQPSPVTPNRFAGKSVYTGKTNLSCSQILTGRLNSATPGQAWCEGFCRKLVSRRLVLRRVQDPNRQRLIAMIHQSSTLFAVAVVVLFVLASDLKSVATYLGLLSAGLLLALQNVIPASLGALLLVGKRGIRIGDRVQVSGITGDVINMGLLQFQLREFDVQKQGYTGHVATFSNSLVFPSPAIGLLKLSSALENAYKPAANKAGREPDLEGRGSAGGAQG